MAKKKEIRNLRPTLLRTEGGINNLQTFSYDTSKYWDAFPEVKLIPPFSEIYAKDKSADKSKSSILMWGFHLLEHPASAVYNLPNKYQLINEKMGKEANYNYEEDPKEFIEAYKDVILPEAYRLLSSWYTKMRERSELLRDLPYSIETMDKLDKAMGATKALWEAFGEIRDQVMLQEGQEIGGKSLSEHGLI
jgi:hypothetical protein